MILEFLLWSYIPLLSFLLKYKIMLMFRLSEEVCWLFQKIWFLPNFLARHQNSTFLAYFSYFWRSNLLQYVALKVSKYGTLEASKYWNFKIFPGMCPWTLSLLPLCGRIATNKKFRTGTVLLFACLFKTKVIFQIYSK